MSDLEEALQSLILAAPTMTALIGSRVTHRTFVNGDPLPRLTFKRISTPRYQTHGATNGGGTASPRFQFDAWGATYADAQAVSNALRALLDGYAGTVSGVVIMSATIEEEREIDDIDPDAGVSGSSTDYIIWHKE